MKMTTTRSKGETHLYGENLAETMLPGSLLLLRGDLGAGKTTLVQGLLSRLGAEPPYPSPTFILMNQYELPQATVNGIERVYHADAYRVGRDDFEKLGFLEWCADPKGLVILEWPERLGDLIPKRHTEVVLRSLSETERELTVTEY